MDYSLFESCKWFEILRPELRDIRQEGNKKTLYRAFCQQEQNLPVFMQDWYLDAVCQEGHWDVALVNEGEEIIATLVYFIKKKWGFTYITMPPFVKVMGPYICPAYRGLKYSHQILEALISQLPKVDGIIQDFHYDVQNWLPFHWEGYRQSSRYTYILYLRYLDAVYENINRNMRRNIKKAQSQLTVRHDLSVEQFYEINRMSFESQGIAIQYSL